jgi:hypothetical protein
VRFTYLDNATLGELRGQALVPKERLLEGALERLGCMDKHSGGAQGQQGQQGQPLLGQGAQQGPGQQGAGTSLGALAPAGPPQAGGQQAQGQQALVTPPRPTYCCNLSYGLPGGSRYLHVSPAAGAAARLLGPCCS